MAGSRGFEDLLDGPDDPLNSFRSDMCAELPAVGGDGVVARAPVPSADARDPG